MITFCISEKDAHKKRCPAPMGTMHDERTQNHCIGDECMAWRWVQTHILKDGVTQLSSNTHGYCGFAGPTPIR